MKCYYHGSDLDGHCSGAIVRYKYPECVMIPINYGQEFPFAEIADGEKVFVVDFSLQEKAMEHLYNKCWGDAKSNLVWIDHHKTALENIRPTLAELIPGKREIGKAGCELTWEYLFPEKDMPIGVKLLGSYDVWNHSDMDTLPYQFGLRTIEDTHPGDKEFWRLIFEDNLGFLDMMITKGRNILEYREIQNKKYARSCAFETYFAGHKAIAINRGLSNSQIFDSVYKANDHKLMITFVMRKGLWMFSLYSKEGGPDVGAIARKYGGGGHEHAAGFSCGDLPFKVK